MDRWALVHDAPELSLSWRSGPRGWVDGEADRSPLVAQLTMNPELDADLQWLVEQAPTLAGATSRHLEQLLEARLARLAEAMTKLWTTESGGVDQRPNIAIAVTQVEWEDLPWELVTHAARQGPAVVRTRTGAETAELGSRTGVARVLMVTARPFGRGDVPHLAVSAGLVEAISSGRVRNIEFEVLRPPTLRALDERLRTAIAERAPFDIVHFDVHGASAGLQQHGVIVLEDGNGAPHRLTGSEIGNTLMDCGVRVVVTNACNAASTGGASDPSARTRLRSFAHDLLSAGLDHVIASAFAVSVETAVCMSQAIYDSIGRGHDLFTAVDAARMALTSQWPSRPLTASVVLRHYSSALPKIFVNAAPSDDEEPLGGDFVRMASHLGEIERTLSRQRQCLVYGLSGAGADALVEAYGEWWNATSPRSVAKAVTLRGADMDPREGARESSMRSRLVVAPNVPDYQSFVSLASNLGRADTLLVGATAGPCGQDAARDDRAIYYLGLADEEVCAVIAGQSQHASGLRDLLLTELVGGHRETLDWVVHECSWSQSSTMAFVDDFAACQWGWARHGVPMPMSVQHVSSGLSQQQKRCLTSVGARYLVLHQSQWSSASMQLVSAAVPDLLRVANGGDGGFEAQVDSALVVLEEIGYACQLSSGEIRLHPFAPFLISACIQLHGVDDATEFERQQFVIEQACATAALLEGSMWRATEGLGLNSSSVRNPSRLQYWVGLLASLRSLNTERALECVYEIWASLPAVDGLEPLLEFADWLHLLFDRALSELGNSQIELRGILHQVFADEAKRKGDHEVELSLREKMWRVARLELQAETASISDDPSNGLSPLTLTTYLLSARELAALLDPDRAAAVLNEALHVALSTEDDVRIASIGTALVLQLRRMGEIEKSLEVAAIILPFSRGISSTSLTPLLTAIGNSNYDLYVSGNSNPSPRKVKEIRDYYFEALAGAGLKRDHFGALIGLGGLELHSGNPALALDFFLRAESASASPESLWAVSYNIVTALHAAGRGDIARAIEAETRRILPT